MLLTDVVNEDVLRTPVDRLGERFPGLIFGKRVDITDEQQVIEGFRFMRNILDGCDILITMPESTGKALLTASRLMTSTGCSHSTSEARFLQPRSIEAVFRAGLGTYLEQFI